MTTRQVGGARAAPSGECASMAARAALIGVAALTA